MQDSFTLSKCAKLSDIIAAIEAGGKQIAIVLSESGKLLGVVTDGDIRRALLAGATMDDSVSIFLRREFLSVTDDISSSDMLNIMKSERVHQLPVLNADGTLVRLEYLDELLQKIQQNVDVVVMAGGRGTRLLPLTADCPKPMLKIGGRPILEMIVRELVGQGMLNITISVNYLRERIVEHFGDGVKFGANIDYLEEQEPMGTAGALADFVPTTDNVLVMNGDVLSTVDYTGLIDFHRASGAVCTMCVRKYETQVPYGVVQIENDQIVGLTEKPVLEQYVNAGIYVLDAQLLDSFKPKGRKDMTELVLDFLSSGFKVSGFPLHEDWLDVGDMSELMRARDLFA